MAHADRSPARVSMSLTVQRLTHFKGRPAKGLRGQRHIEVSVRQVTEGRTNRIPAGADPDESGPGSRHKGMTEVIQAP